MRLRSLAVVVLLASGCQQPAQSEPAAVLELQPSPEKDPGTQPTGLEAPGPESPGEPPDAPAASGEPQAAAGSPPTAADALPELTWSARSADGKAEVQQTGLRDGKGSRCTSTSTVTPPGDEPSVMWRWTTCIATAEQLRFVSADGKRVLVVDMHPASYKGSWKDVEVATLYEHGVRLRGAKAEALVTTPIEVREPSLRFAWVKEGSAPRYTSDGKAVEFETVDGRAFRLGFEGEGFPTPPEEKHVFSEAAGMYRYEDEKGTVHVVGSASEVPARYRSRAKPVDAHVGLLTVSGPLGGVEPSEPEPRSPTVASKASGNKEPLEKARVPTPAELLDKARDTVKQVEEAQRIREHLADSQLSENPSRAGEGPPASASQAATGVAKSPEPQGPLPQAKVPTTTELLERAHEAVKKLETSQQERERLMDSLPSETPSNVGTPTR
jgi:hypothetical protein